VDPDGNRVAAIIPIAAYTQLMADFGTFVNTAGEQLGKIAIDLAQIHQRFLTEIGDPTEP